MNDRPAAAVGASGGRCPGFHHTHQEKTMTGPACGNNPNYRMSDGDRQAVVEFRAYLTRRAALLEAAETADELSMEIEQAMKTREVGPLTALQDLADKLRHMASEAALSPYYEHPECGFHWHGRDGMDIPMRDGQPVCPRCELAKVQKKLDHTQKLRDEVGVECKRRGKRVLEQSERVIALERQVDEVQRQLGAEILRAGQAEAELRRVADETAATETDDFTEARAAFMQISRTPSLEGLRAELRIEGQEPIIGRYCGASMGRMHDVPGHEHLLAVDPRLIFEYAEEQPAAGARQDGAQR